MGRAICHRAPHGLLPLARLGRCLLMLVLASTTTFHSCAQSASADEYDIRAAMLFNLTKFIDWPTWKMDPAHPDFNICIFGSDPLGADLDGLLRNKTVEAKPVIVLHISSIDLATGCHILYVGAGERRSVVRASAELARNAVLTVSEKSNSDDSDQIVGLPAADDHVHIDVNLGAAQRSGLIVSSKLLRLATVTY